MLKRILLVATAFAVLVSGATVVALLAQETDPVVEVYKSPTCGCCSVWVTHLEEHGFSVKTNDVRSMGGVKQEAGVPRGVYSCHTAFVDGYVVEGHVPAEDIQRLLDERPAVAGIGVGGMPIGSPGMEGPNPQPYDVLAFDEDGNLSHFASHGP